MGYEIDSKDSVGRAVEFGVGGLNHWVFNAGCGLRLYNMTHVNKVEELTGAECEEIGRRIDELEAYLVALLESKFEEVA